MKNILLDTSIVTDARLTFKDLMMVILQALIAKLAACLTLVLEAMDTAIALSGKMKGWESIGKRGRVIITLYGIEIRYRRRGYRREVEGKVEYRYPLDEKLGLREGERFCPLVQSIAIALATKMTYREAAEFMRHYLLVSVSHQEIHRWVQEAGKAREEEQKEKEEGVYQRGEKVEGEGSAEVVVIEADELRVARQRQKGKKIEIKLGTLHEGWEKEAPGSDRVRLKGKSCWGGVMEGERFWERGSIIFHSRYDEEKVKCQLINGDGANWIKQGKEYFPKAHIYLDRFHRNKALKVALGFAPGLLEEAHRAKAARGPCCFKVDPF